MILALSCNGKVFGVSRCLPFTCKGMHLENLSTLILTISHVVIVISQTLQNSIIVHVVAVRAKLKYRHMGGIIGRKFEL